MDVAVPLEWIWLGYGMLALIVGSFISLLTGRLTNWLTADTLGLWRTIGWTRSHCTHCQTPLSAWHLIPVLSWAWHKSFMQGKTNCCQQAIPIRYPLIELSSLGLVLLLLSVTPLEMRRLDWTIQLSFIAHCLFLWSLLAISITDIEHHIIPDRLSLTLLWLGLAVNVSDSMQLVSSQAAIWGAILGYVSLWLIFQGHRAITGRVGMGYGDFKLTAAIGAWLGWQALIPLFIIAGVGAILFMGTAIVLGKHQLSQSFAFGPWLSIAGVLLMLLA